MNSLPKTVTRQRRDCDLIPGPSAPESSIDVKTLFTFFKTFLNVFFIFQMLFYFFKNIGKVLNLKFNGFINNRILYPVIRM